MLGAALASQYAGWWSQGNASISVAVTASSTASYALEQSPSFSWLNIKTSGTSTPPGVFGTIAVPAAGNMAVGNVTSLSSYNNYRWTQFITFALDYPTGIAQNDGFKYDQKFQGNSGDFTTNFAWVRGYSGGNELELNWPGVEAAIFPEDYANYNGRWMTAVGSVSNTASSFSNWTGPTTGSTYYARLAVFDTETGQLIVKTDSGQSGRPLGFPTDFATWITSAGNNISTTRTDAYSWSLGEGNPTANCKIAVTNIWTSFGTMFDPLTESDTSWRTTRPSATIGNATAWFNGQFGNVANTTGYANAWATASGMDRFTPQDTDVQINLITGNNGNSTVFNDRYSTTNVPISTG